MTSQPLQLDRDTFLARYWQREHLLLRGALPDFRPPLNADELAGLALEDSVEARIIEQREGDWQLYHGPFTAADYDRQSPWTLLVQAVDHYLPEVAALRQLVDFIPAWRLDDVMVSYAVDGGSVGPHYDNYDVFLLQGAGERVWKVGQFCDQSTPLLPNPDLRIVADFQCQAEYTLRTGDILYVPPGTAHWGIAKGECTTFSIGFRAPRINDMVSRWTDKLLEQMEPDQFYRDHPSSSMSRPGEIHSSDLEQALGQLRKALDQPCGKQWFGELVTEPRYEPVTEAQDLAEANKLLLAGNARVELAAEAKLAWQQQATGVTVFANGDSKSFSSAVLADILLLCEHWRLEEAQLAQSMACEERASLLTYLLECGCIYVE